MSTSDPFPLPQNCCILHAGFSPSARTLSPWNAVQFTTPSALAPGSSLPRLGNDILCQCIPGPGDEHPHKNAPKNKKAEDFSSASFRLVPSPRYFAKSKNLLERGLGSGAAGKRSGGVTHHGIGDRAEGAHARGVLSQRICVRVIGRGRGTTGAQYSERVPALGA